MADSFSNRIKIFNRSLQLNAALPPHIGVLNPFTEDSLARRCSEAFYNKFYSDNGLRYGIFGINPGRFGGGLTGVPFTDFKRLQEVCGIGAQGKTSNEPSSYFIYQMIAAMGGVTQFYQHFYISSVCPLGFVISKSPGRPVNYNYYDDPALYTAVKPFIVQTIRQQIALGLHTRVCFCLGKKNFTFFSKLNEDYHFFESITELPHPRFVVQYRFRMIADYVAEYCKKIRSCKYVIMKIKYRSRKKIPAAIKSVFFC